MSQSEGAASRGDGATFDRFLSVYWADFDAGRRRRLKEYFDLFPGIEDEIAREVVRIDDSAPADDDRERISVYRLDREIADGGQGRVYLAHHVHTGQRVALKLLRREHRFDIPSQMRMKREASALARLSHPGICAVHDLGEHEGSIFIAMQWIEGETMYRRIDRDRRAATDPATPTDPADQDGSFFIGNASIDPETTTRGVEPPRPTSTERVTPPAPSDRRRPTAAIRSRPPGDVKEIADMFVEVCRAMHVAHEAGIVHRDLKPGNIMIRPDGRPVVIDFGLASVADAEPLTVQSQMLGTPSHMRPWKN